jgi:hypothetical protein
VSVRGFWRRHNEPRLAPAVPITEPRWRDFLTPEERAQLGERDMDEAEIALRMHHGCNQLDLGDAGDAGDAGYSCPTCSVVFRWTARGDGSRFLVPAIPPKTPVPDWATPTGRRRR